METIVRFGPQERLVGLLSGAGAMDPPTLVLPSAGLLPRAGPFRLHVELARRLAAHGIGTFRFEAPGVGETPRMKGWGAREATLGAIDHLARAHGCSRFVVGGICSAADAGWSAALADPRVVGLLMLDGISFTGPWYQAARITDVLQRPPRMWPGVLRRGWNRVRRREAAPDVGDYREWPDRGQARRQFQALLGRGVRSLWIYTGGYTDRFLHPRQFAWSMGPAAHDRRVTMHYWRDCDHTFYARPHRDRLLATVERWMIEEVKGATP